MPVAPTCVDSLLELCRKSGLIDEPVLARFLRTNTLADDPVKAAMALIQNGLLTRFQASQLLTGRHRGFRIGPLRVLDKLGKGGNASVLLCEHSVMKRRVAVKVLPEKNARDTATRERFYREARAAAILDHPNIVRTHDISSQGEMHYLVMDYIDGTDLQITLNNSGPMSYPVAVGFGLQAAAGLQHAHSKGLVHRDVKPANLLVGKDGVLKLLDMGLARFFLDPKDDLTQQFDKGMVLGTIDFLAPEQAIASNKIDSRVDIYSLGVTLYTMIVGKPPFEGSPAQKLLQVQLRIPPALNQVNPRIPLGLSQIVAKMMAKDANDRYQRIEDVIEALSPWATHQDEVALGSTIIAQKTTVTESVPVQSPTSQKVRSALPPRRTVTPSASAAARPRRSHYWVWYVAPACLAVAVGVAVGVSKRNSGGDLAANPKYLTPSVQSVAATTPATPDRPAADPAILYRFSAANLVPYFERRHGKELLEKSGAGKAPTGWNASCYKPEAIGEFMIQEVAGATGFGLRATGGELAAQFTTSFNDRLKHLTAGTRYGLRFHYFGEEATKGIAAVRGRNYKHLAKSELRPTAGEWRMVEILFTANDEPLDFAIQPTVVHERSGIFITDLEFYESAPAAAANEYRLHRLDLAKTTPFTQWLKGSEVLYRDGRGELPAPWAFRTVKGGSIGEVFVDQASSEKYVGFRHNEGEPAMQLFTKTPVAECRAGARYLVRIEFRTDDKAQSALKVRHDLNGSDIAAIELKPTNGRWQSATIALTPTRTGGAYVIVQNDAADRAAELRVRSIEMVELH